jgi:carbohydrate kinase (thermoresistant glucokinase family)
MGVSGCGKSTLARALAQRLALPFVEGDELHPVANVAKMAAGTPLTDDDRQGWLEAIAARLAGAGEGGVIVTCSALKRRYRDLLRRSAPDLRLVHLHGAAPLIEQRLRLRAGHYMPASLLQSQLDTLEPPLADEHAVVLPITATPEALVEATLRELAPQTARH